MENNGKIKVQCTKIRFFDAKQLIEVLILKTMSMLVHIGCMKRICRDMVPKIKLWND